MGSIVGTEARLICTDGAQPKSGVFVVEVKRDAILQFQEAEGD
jgi:hypothetical protein